jgi:hypothetical protein
VKGQFAQSSGFDGLRNLGLPGRFLQRARAKGTGHGIRGLGAWGSGLGTGDSGVWGLGHGILGPKGEHILWNSGYVILDPVGPKSLRPLVGPNTVGPGANVGPNSIRPRPNAARPYDDGTHSPLSRAISFIFLTPTADNDAGECGPRDREKMQYGPARRALPRGCRVVGPNSIRPGPSAARPYIWPDAVRRQTPRDQRRWSKAERCSALR